MFVRLHRWFTQTLWLLPVAWLWCVLVDNLRIEWMLNPQYAYGWVVPFLCLYLLWQRVQRRTTEPPAPSGDSLPRLHSRLVQFSAVLTFVLCAFLYAPVRLVQQAVPEWRLVGWALAGITLGLTLLLLRFRLLGCDVRYAPSAWSAFQPSNLSAFVFPLGFFLVAVPWPTLVEGPLVQGLTGANAAATVEVLAWTGIPAIRHGNVIEVGTGVVGIDEACSGIRSFQATLMISLFLGELYRLSVLRRLALCLAGFALSFVFNVGRTGLLTWVAARDGVDAISKWHDSAGVTILVGCFLGLWALGTVLRRKSNAVAASHATASPVAANVRPRAHADRDLTIAATTNVPVAAACGSAQPFPPTGVGSHSPKPNNHSPLPPPLSDLRSRPPLRLSAVLILWFVCVELGVESWYRMHEQAIGPAETWFVQAPGGNPTLRHLSFSENSRRLLRFDEGLNLRWQEDGQAWQLIFLRWNPGKVAVHLARGHMPEVCLRATGRKVGVVSELRWVDVAGLRLPCRLYAVQDGHVPAHVLYCLWEDRGEQSPADAGDSGYRALLAPVFQGRRNLGQRSLELVVWGIEDDTPAEAALVAQLRRVVLRER